MPKKVVYYSGCDYTAEDPEWVEVGELPDCVDFDRVGHFSCECGEHHVLTGVSTDPCGQYCRIARTVWSVEVTEEELAARH